MQENLQDDRVRRRVRVRGHVQGVFYRDSVRQQAQLDGVAGWAANCSDGSVEVVLEGPADAVESVMRFVVSGPPRAQVEELAVDEEEPEGLTSFEVR